MATADELKSNTLIMTDIALFPPLILPRRLVGDALLRLGQHCGRAAHASGHRGG